jgi:hypothetical protein
MTQEQAIQRGFTHFIEVWHDVNSKQGDNYGYCNVFSISNLDNILSGTKNLPKLYTVAIFLIKPKLK